MSPLWLRVCCVLPGLLLAPLLMGVIGKTKALVAGRKGAPLLQLYWDLSRLLRKGAVYSTTTTWVFKAGPSLALGALLAAYLLLPAGPVGPPLSFPGDLVLFAYLLALARFAIIAAAMDTGSAFEGMGASREAAFSALAEPAVFLVLGVLAWTQGSLSLGPILAGSDLLSSGGRLPALVLTAAALFLALLAENSRIPIDDPATHLELTMIHEVMVLDHSGPDFAFILYGAALKLWIFGSLLVAALLPAAGSAWAWALAFYAGMALVGVLVGLVEGSTARIRLRRVPQYLGLAAALAGLAALLVMAGAPR